MFRSTSATREGNTIRWWRKRPTRKGQNVTTTTGLRIEKKQAAKIQTSKVRDPNILSGQVDDALVRCKKEFTNILRKIFNEF
jgi:hypothetical protein